MPVTMGMHLVYLPRLGVWMRYRPIDLLVNAFRDVDDFRLGSEGDVLRRWTPRRTDDRSGCRVCSVRQSVLLSCYFLNIKKGNVFANDVSIRYVSLKIIGDDQTHLLVPIVIFSRRTFILVPLNKSCSSIACSSQVKCLELSDF